MKALDREFTLLEKLILVVLSCFLIFLIYYNFVDKPVSKQTAEAEADIAELQMMNEVLESKAMRLSDIQEEYDAIKGGSGTLSYLASYNNGNAEMEFLHKTLTVSESYNITFSDVTQDGELIRRKVVLTYVADGYDVAKEILQTLVDSELRTLVSDVKVSANTKDYPVLGDGEVAVNCTVTFYETMADGTGDEGLPSGK